MDHVDGRAVSFEKIFKLHKAIRMFLVMAPFHLSMKELKFLRQERGISAFRMSCIAQKSILVFEGKRGLHVPDITETIYRALAATSNTTDEEFKEMLNSISPENVRPERYVFAFKNDKWEYTTAPLLTVAPEI